MLVKRENKLICPHSSLEVAQLWSFAVTGPLCGCWWGSCHTEGTAAVLRQLPDCRLPTGAFLMCAVSPDIFQMVRFWVGIFLNHDLFFLRFTASKFLIRINKKHSFQLWIFIQISLQEQVLQLDKPHLNFFKILKSKKFFPSIIQSCCLL